jgi:hypothetical protein
MSTFSLALREKLHDKLHGTLHLNSAHPDLHKTIYLLCIPSLIAAANAAIYYMVHGYANWSTLSTVAAWTMNTYAAPWIALLANIAATVVFIIFSRHKRVRSHSKVAVSTMLTLAWLGTFLSFLVVE